MDFLNSPGGKKKINVKYKIKIYRSVLACDFQTSSEAQTHVFLYNQSLVTSHLKMVTFTSGCAAHISTPIFISELSVTVLIFSEEIKISRFSSSIIWQTKHNISPSENNLKWRIEYSSCIGHYTSGPE